MTPWVYVMLMIRSSYSLSVYSLNKSEEHEVTTMLSCIQNSCPADYCFCISTRWSNCIKQSWICDGMMDCHSGEDEEDCPVSEATSEVLSINYEDEDETSRKIEVNFMENFNESFWTFFIFCAIMSVLCLTRKKGGSLDIPEDVEQSQPQDHCTASCSQHLPQYYLHTLHRQPWSPPTTAIQSGGSGHSGNAEATYSSVDSNQGRNHP